MKKIAITISAEQMEKAKKLYEFTKKNQQNFNLSLDEFLEELLKNAFETHLQFSDINENMSKMIKNFSESLSDTFKFDETLKDFDSMVQDIFKNNVENTTKENDKNNKNDDKKIKN